MRTHLSLFLLVLMPLTSSAQSQNKPALTQNLWEAWFEMTLNGQKFGSLYERLDVDNTHNVIQYANRTCTKADKFEQRVASLSRTEDLVPISFTFKELVGGKLTREEEGEFDIKERVMRLLKSKQTVDSPAAKKGNSFIFSGTFPLLVHAEQKVKLKKNTGYQFSVFMEDKNTIVPGYFQWIPASKKEKETHLVFRLDQAEIHYWVDAAGFPVRSKLPDGSLVTEKTTREIAESHCPQ